MFSLEDAYTNITLDDIFSKVSEYELWRYYCQNFDSLDRPFRSEFYNDNNPDCWIFKSGNNRLKYKDFGTGEHYTIIEYIQRKYNCTFRECITIISNDFKLARSNILVNKETRLLNFEENEKKVKSRIDILSKPFNYSDFQYWNRYKITFELLEKYKIFSCSQVYLFKGNKITTYNYTKSNPIYAYKFNNSYKIYKPLESNKQYKWLFSGSKEDIEGYDQLSLTGDLLIITKSLKDVLVYRLLGYDAISLQGEANILTRDLYIELSRRFKTIIVNYDEDRMGIDSSERMYNIYGIKYFYIDDKKDISDYIECHTIDETKDLIKRKLEEIDE